MPEAGVFVKLMIFYPRQDLRGLVRQKYNGNHLWDRILKEYPEVVLPLVNTFRLIIYLIVLQVLKGFVVQTARYAINSVMVP